MTSREIGVAIGLPEPLGAHLRGWRARFGDPAARLIVPHVTLLGPTIVDESDVETVVRHLARAAAAVPPFTLRLAGTETFLPVSPVVYLAVVAGATRCGALAAAVRTGPLDVPVRFPYHPHVTLAQNVPRGALEVARERFAEFDAALDIVSFGLFRRDARGWAMSHEFALGRCPDPVGPATGHPGVPTAAPA